MKYSLFSFPHFLSTDRSGPGPIVPFFLGGSLKAVSPSEGTPFNGLSFFFHDLSRTPAGRRRLCPQGWTFGTSSFLFFPNEAYSALTRYPPANYLVCTPPSVPDDVRPANFSGRISLIGLPLLTIEDMTGRLVRLRGVRRSSALFIGVYFPVSRWLYIIPFPRRPPFHFAP